MIRPIKYSRYRIVVNYWVKIHEQEYVIDTVAGDFYIYCRTEDNQNIVSTTHYKYADRSSVLTVREIMEN